MKHTRIILLFACFSLQMISCAKLTYADEKAWAASMANSTATYNKALIRHIGTFDFRWVTEHPESTWALTEIFPSEHTGRTEGITTDPVTKEISVDAGKTPEVVLDGTLKLISGLNGYRPTTSSWNYKWDVPIMVSKQYIGVPMNTPYFPFWSRNPIICRINTSRGDGNPVDVSESQDGINLFLVPREWVQFVVPACNYIRTNSNVFDEGAVDKNIKQLNDLTWNSNPFLNIAACRILSKGGKLDEKQITNLLQSTSSTRQATLAFVLATNVHKDEKDKEDIDLLTDDRIMELLGKWNVPNKEKMSPEMARAVAMQYAKFKDVPTSMVSLEKSVMVVVEKCQNSAQVQGLALGLAIAKYSEVPDDFDARPDVLNGMLEHIKVKAGLWGINTSQDKLLDSWLRYADLPKGK